MIPRCDFQLTTVEYLPETPCSPLPSSLFPLPASRFPLPASRFHEKLQLREGHRCRQLPVRKTPTTTRLGYSGTGTSVPAPRPTLVTDASIGCRSTASPSSPAAPTRCSAATQMSTIRKIYSSLRCPHATS